MLAAAQQEIDAVETAYRALRDAEFARLSQLARQVRVQVNAALWRNPTAGGSLLSDPTGLCRLLGENVPGHMQPGLACPLDQRRGRSNNRDRPGASALLRFPAAYPAPTVTPCSNARQSIE